MKYALIFAGRWPSPVQGVHQRLFYHHQQHEQVVRTVPRL